MISHYFLSKDIITLCENFAENVIGTNISEYSKRKQTDIDKIKKDIVTGKLAEWGVYFIYSLRKRNIMEPPCMRILSKDKKSFDPDLKWGLFNLHIKSQTHESSTRYGDSWIFQAKDPLFGFSNEYDIVIGCSVLVEKEGALVEIKLEKPFRTLIIGETKLSKFSENKRAIYLKDNDG
jgi:hypothetical protein